MAYDLCLSCDKALVHTHDEWNRDIMFCDDACEQAFNEMSSVTLIDTLDIEEHEDGVHETHILLWSNGKVTTQVREIALELAYEPAPGDDCIPF